MLYFWKAECSRMSNMTFPCVNTIQLGPSPFNSSPQCKKSSLRYHFSRNSRKLGSQKLLAKAFFFLPIWAKNGQKRTAENFRTTYLDPKSKSKNCTLFSSILHLLKGTKVHGDGPAIVGWQGGSLKKRILHFCLRPAPSPDFASNAFSFRKFHHQLANVVINKLSSLEAMPVQNYYLITRSQCKA